MAMNKREQAEMESLRMEVAIARALRFTEDVPPDVEPPKPCSGELRKGFLYNAYDMGRVEPACTSSIFHSFGRDDKTTTQDARPLYSTRLRALRAMRRDFEMQYAKNLARIDRQIEEEKTHA